MSRFSGSSGTSSLDECKIGFGRPLSECKKEKKKSLLSLALKELGQGDFEYRNDSPNNIDHPEWGDPGYQLLRAAAPQYGDGISTPAGSGRPSPREISNVIFDHQVEIPNKKNGSALLWAWGQFLDHDVGLSLEASPHESFPIPIPTGDEHFDPNGDGDKELSFSRSEWDQTTGTSTENPRQQMNAISAFIDASNVYGSTPERTAWLRYFKGGLLRTSMGDMLPYNDGTMPNVMGMSSTFYVAGDVRSNEHLALLSMHTLWVREHNYWATRLHKRYPNLSDEELFQRARVMVESEVQCITIKEFLPLMLGGSNVFGPYTGYNPEANPQMRNEFTTAAYRLGHTLIGSAFPRLQEDGTPIKEGNLLIRDAFFSPFKLTNDQGIDPIFRGLATTPSDEFDGTVIDDLRNFLFGTPGNGGLDLTSLNIQRGRDHGLADYNTTRVAYGMPAIDSFDEVVSDPTIVSKLVDLYGTPNNADLYVVLQVEDHAGNSMLGPTTMAILAEQALRIRTGDRLWFEGRLPESLYKLVSSTKLSDVILRNTGIKSIQRNVMEVQDR